MERVRARMFDAGICPAGLDCDACQGLEIRNGGEKLKRLAGAAN